MRIRATMIAAQAAGAQIVEDEPVPELAAWKTEGEGMKGTNPGALWRESTIWLWRASA
jgi:hypothetical protein